MNIDNKILTIIAIAILSFFGWQCTNFVLNHNRYIETRGVSVKTVKSDSAIWSITIYNETDDLRNIQEKRSAEKHAVLRFLSEQGVTEKECTIETKSDIEDNYDKYKYSSSGKPTDQKKYTIHDVITIKTNKVDEINKISSGIMVLANKGIVIRTAIRYYYHDIGKLRIDMIKEAAIDARDRADHIAKVSETKVIRMRNISINNFSITSAEISDTKDYDYYDNEEHAIMKKIRVVVRGTFDIG
ncbi:MAG: SIMPL domain-containing protein [Holosporales bacterium]|jgi:hypothetical protein|nr:SIMPL domain-containing protein [Holosporales bacterium]